MTFAWLITYSRVALGTDQGRLLFPAIAPLALLLVGGLAQWLPGSWREHESRWLAGWTGLMGTVAVLALVTGLWIPYAPPAAPAAAEIEAAKVAAETSPAPAGQSFGGQLELIGYRWEPANRSATQRDLAVYWRSVRPIATDLRTSLRLRDERGEVIWESKRSPGVGRFSTDRWPAGRTVADVYAVPTDLLGRATAVEIGVQPFPEGPWLGLEHGADRLSLAVPSP
jgi:hypothetical protein